MHKTIISTIVVSLIPLFSIAAYDHLEREQVQRRKENEIFAAARARRIDSKVSAPEEAGLQLVSTPKPSNKIWKSTSLSAGATKSKQEYDRLYNSFVSLARDAEEMYFKYQTKSLQTLIAEYNKVAKSPSWKNIGSGSPSNVKWGVQLLTKDISRLGQLNSDIYVSLRPQAASRIKFWGVGFDKPTSEEEELNNCSTDLERAHKQNEIAARQLVKNKDINPDYKKQIRFIIQQQREIENEARDKGEHWVR